MPNEKTKPKNTAWRINAEMAWSQHHGLSTWTLIINSKQYNAIQYNYTASLTALSELYVRRLEWQNHEDKLEKA